MRGSRRYGCILGVVCNRRFGKMRSGVQNQFIPQQNTRDARARAHFRWDWCCLLLDQIGTLIAERLLYMPSAGLCMLLGMLLAKAPSASATPGPAEPDTSRAAAGHAQPQNPLLQFIGADPRDTRRAGTVCPRRLRPPSADLFFSFAL